MGRFIIGKRNRVDKAKDILIIPRHLVSLRFIELPSLDLFELRSMAEFHALKELPYAKEELIISSRNIGSYKKGFSYIMLVIAKRQDIQKMMGQEDGKLKNIRLETEIMYSYILKRDIAKQNKVSLIMSIRKDYLEIMIIDNMKPVFSRGLKNKEEWLKETNLSVSSYRRKAENKEIEELIILSCQGADIENIKQGMKALSAIPANFYEYKEDLNSPEESLEIDLLPKEYIDKKLNNENKKQILVTYFLLFVVISMLSCFFVFKVKEKTRTIAMISEKMEKIQKDVDGLRTFLKKIEFLKYQKDEGERIVGILKECCELVPQDILLTGLEYGEEGILYCKGMTGNMPSVFDFIKVLEKSKYFKKVEVKYAAKKETGNKEFIDFDVACFAR